MRIVTDKKWKPFLYRNEVPATVLTDTFSCLDPDQSGDQYFKYKNMWFHLSDFILLEGNEPWLGCHGLTAFSAVLIEVSKDGERYRVGMQLS